MWLLYSFQKWYKHTCNESDLLEFSLFIIKYRNINIFTVMYLSGISADA